MKLKVTLEYQTHKRWFENPLPNCALRELEPRHFEYIEQLHADIGLNLHKLPEDLKTVVSKDSSYEVAGSAKHFWFDYDVLMAQLGKQAKPAGLKTLGVVFFEALMEMRLWGVRRIVFAFG